MKKKEKTAFHDMKQAEIAKAIAEAKEKLAGFMINRYSKQSKNVREGRELRKKIAVARSVIRIKELRHE